MAYIYILKSGDDVIGYFDNKRCMVRAYHYGHDYPVKCFRRYTSHLDCDREDHNNQKRWRYVHYEDQEIQPMYKQERLSEPNIKGYSKWSDWKKG
jgi:hypothetical protein